jgi:hypothetical protein
MLIRIINLDKKLTKFLTKINTVKYYKMNMKHTEEFYH